MDCKQHVRGLELINVRIRETEKSFAIAAANQRQREFTPTLHQKIDDPISGTLAALDRRLEMIRKEQLAKNRSNLRHLDTQQLEAVEWVTTNITRMIFREVADELEHSASQGNGKSLSETICLMLGLA